MKSIYLMILAIVFCWGCHPQPNPAPTQTPTPNPVFRTAVPIPEPTQFGKVLCVGDSFIFSPTARDMYHYFNLILHDAPNKNGEISLHIPHGEPMIRHNSALLDYVENGVPFTFQAKAAGTVTGELHILTESLSRYGYAYWLMTELTIQIDDC